METQKLIEALRDASINACGCRCGNLYDDAVSQLETLQAQVDGLKRTADAEKKACFRLGQMDMRESAVAALRDTGTLASGQTRFILSVAADIVMAMEVMS